LRLPACRPRPLCIVTAAQLVVRGGLVSMVDVPTVKITRVIVVYIPIVPAASTRNVVIAITIAVATQ
jgi:hypothetical protein